MSRCSGAPILAVDICHGTPGLAEVGEKGHSSSRVVTVAESWQQQQKIILYYGTPGLCGSSSEVIWI